MVKQKNYKEVTMKLLQNSSSLSVHISHNVQMGLQWGRLKKNGKITFHFVSVYFDMFCLHIVFVNILSENIDGVSSSDFDCQWWSSVIHGVLWCSGREEGFHSSRRKNFVSNSVFTRRNF